jgi:hypothetical protein
MPTGKATVCQCVSVGEFADANGLPGERTAERAAERTATRAAWVSCITLAQKPVCNFNRCCL